MCMYIYIYTYICACTCIYIYIHMYFFMCIHIYICISIHTYRKMRGRGADLTKIHIPYMSPGMLLKLPGNLKAAPCIGRDSKPRAKATTGSAVFACLA